MGEMTKETAFEILDYYHSQGGNFIDTAKIYQDEQSEVEKLFTLASATPQPGSSARLTSMLATTARANSSSTKLS